MSTPEERVERVERVEHVERVVDAFAEAWNRHDMQALAELFAADAEFVNVVGLWWRGREEIRAAHEATHATIFQDSRLTVLEKAVRFPSTGLALARSRWRLEGHVDPSGAALPARSGLLMFLLVDQDGRWIVVDAQNTDIVEGVASRPQ